MIEHTAYLGLGGNLGNRLSTLRQARQKLEDSTFALTFEDRFRLLEHEELQEARQSSRRAMYIAIASILLSIIISAFTVFSVQQVEVIKPSNDHQPMMKMESSDTTQ